MKKMRYINKKRKSIIIIVFVVLLLLLPIFVINNKGNKANRIIEEFKARGVLVETKTVLKNSKEYNVEYYVVKKKFEYEDTSRKIANNYQDTNIGTIGDIYITSSDLFGTYITKWFFEKTKASHAGIVYDIDGTKTVEIVGNNKKANNVVKIYDNDWLIQDGLDEVVVLRCKHINNDNEIELIDWLDEKTESKYNYLYFIKNKEKYYCSDLVTRAIENVTNININKKEILVTGSNMILSDETYLIYYCEKISKENVDYRVYILEDN